MATKTTFDISTDSTFLTTATQMSKLDRTYQSLDRRIERMPEAVRNKFETACEGMMEDYIQLLDFTSEYIKDAFNNRKTGLVTKMTRSGRLWHPKYNPEGITELYFRWSNPKKQAMEALGFGLGKNYHKPDDFHFAFNTLWEGGCWKKNRSGEEYFSNDYFLNTFREHRITVPSGVSAAVVLTKRKLASSFIRVLDVSDKTKSDMEVWEVRFYYKSAMEFASKRKQEQTKAAKATEVSEEKDEEYPEDFAEETAEVTAEETAEEMAEETAEETAEVSS
jgi:hypothetical protein